MPILTQIDSPSSDVIVALVTFNNNAPLHKLLTILDADPALFDIVIVHNQASEHQALENESFLSTLKHHVVYVPLKENLGGAGGYNFAVNYSIKHGYQKIILTEDDAFPLTRNIISTLIACSPKNNNAEVKAVFVNNNTSSFAFHYTLYPRKLLAKSGPPLAYYFMRNDDLEFSLRVDRAKKSLSYSTIVVPFAQYYHPIFKSTANPWPLYFSIRNTNRTSLLHSDLVMSIKSLLACCMIGVGYSVFTNKISPIKLLVWGIFDFLLPFNSNRWSLNNQKVMQYAKSIQYSADCRLNLQFEKMDNSDPKVYGKLILSSYLTPKLILAFLLSEFILFIDNGNEEPHYTCSLVRINKLVGFLKFIECILILIIVFPPILLLAQLKIVLSIMSKLINRFAALIKAYIPYRKA